MGATNADRKFLDRGDLSDEADQQKVLRTGIEGLSMASPVCKPFSLRKKAITKLTFSHQGNM